MKHQYAGRTITERIGVAGALAYTVQGTVTFTLVGSVYGSGDGPGTVILGIGDDQHYVTEPSRFGNAFGLSFVKRWIDAEDEARGMLDEPRPELVECPACLSPRGEACTQPTDNGRSPVTWYHHSRIDAVKP